MFTPARKFNSCARVPCKTMPDWLNLLRAHKAQAIDEQQQSIKRSQHRQQREANKLPSGQAQLLATLQATAVETLLLQLAEHIVAGHPLYSTAYLQRKVEYSTSAELAYVDTFVNDPWQGRLWDARGQRSTVRLPAQPHLPRGFFLAKIKWHFHLCEKRVLDYRIACLIVAELQPRQLTINGHDVHPLSCAAAQHALAHSLEHPWEINQDY